MELPRRFIEYISAYPSLAPLAESLLSAPEVSIRLNPSKLSPREAEAFAIAGVELEPVEWCPEGRYLSSRPQFTFDPRLHQGLYYVQDASSMAVTAAIRSIAPAAPVAYLDMCAAPGGKTTAAISALPHGSMVVANEYDYKRAEILAENMAKWGSPYAMATRGDTKRIAKALPETFDIVAVDAPCSGEGMMRKDDKAREQWSEALVRECAAVQRDILANAWAALKPGGHLIYSTCTFNRSENEDNIDWLVSELGAEPLQIAELDASDTVAEGVMTDYPCYRFIPGKARGEGLFLCLLRKPGELRAAKPNARAKAKALAEMQSIARWLDPSVEWRLERAGDDVYALPAPQAHLMACVAKELDAHMPGLRVATIKGKDIVPAHELAMSAALRHDAFPVAEVDSATAVAYLQRQNVQPEGAPRGYVLLTHGGHPLGFVKNMSNRANNLYPKNWRIRSAAES